MLEYSYLKEACIVSRLIIDPKLAEALFASHEPIELVHPNGQIVGRFTPSIDLAESELSEEETRRRLAEGRKRYTTDEVIAHLRNLP